mmetsp:Transcript_115525/g.258054  ORF Transcript_115525/g.258054 Transcript_115525/m.258054 type:complete len:288 (-) Transcript_115525:9-872(-)
MAPVIHWCVCLFASSLVLLASSLKLPAQRQKVEDDQNQIEKPGPLIFYLSLQKGGSTTFAHFMAEQMGVRSLHASASFYKDIGFPNWGPGACNTSGVGPTSPKWEPDYAAVARELDVKKVKSWIDSHDFQSFSDMPWPVLYQWLDETYPDSKFIFWARNSSEWEDSAKDFFDGSHPRRMMTLDYGACKTDFLQKDQLIRIYEGHVRSVRTYFNGTWTPQQRKDRFLEFDMTTPTAANELCDFLSIGKDCSEFGPMPHENDRRSNLLFEDDCEDCSNLYFLQSRIRGL